MSGKFTLDINLGNAAMDTPAAVAELLREAADKLDNLSARQREATGRLRDGNGNTVGKWSYDNDPDEDEGAGEEEDDDE